MLAALDIERMLLEATLREQGGGDDEGRRDLKLIMISAIDQREPLMEALKLGAVDYIVKPFEKERVEEAMQRVQAG